MFDRIKELRPWLSLQRVRNQTVSWIPTDSKERYDSNMREHSERMHELGWDDTSRISYRINGNGLFRGDDFVESGAMFLGCSFTFGIGVPEENSWATLVARELGLPCNNLGTPGASNDTLFRLAYVWIPILKPKILFMLSTNKERLEVFHNRNKPQNYNPALLTSFPRWYADVWLADDRNSENNKRRNILAIEMLCHKNNCQLIHMEYDPETSDEDGRDLMHPGVEWHQRIANEFLQKMT